MADSPSTTILSRRNALAAAGAALAFTSFSAEHATASGQDAILLDLKRQWMRLRELVDAARGEEDRALGEMVKNMPPPPPGLNLKNINTGKTRLLDEYEIKIHEMFWPTSLCDQKREMLAEYRIVQKDVRARHGVLAAEGARESAELALDAIERQILATPAQGVHGILVKLEVTRFYIDKGDCGEFWEQAFSAVESDAERLTTLQT